MTPLYRRMLGDRFELLSPMVRHLHDLQGPTTWKGTASVERGKNPFARLAGWLTSLPPAGEDVALKVSFAPDAQGETWERHFGSSRFCTRQFARNGWLCERAGPATFQFSLVVEDGALVLALAGMHFIGLPVPRFLQPSIVTREEQAADGTYRFSVSSQLPVIGLLVAYRGWLAPEVRSDRL